MRIKRVPLDISYKTIRKLSWWNDVVLYLSTAVSLAVTLFGEHAPLLKTVLIGSNVFLTILFVYLEDHISYVFINTEMKRRLDLLDNSFDSNFSINRSEGYFTNDELSTGVYKLAVNGFENSFHTSFIIRKMTVGIGIKTLFVVAVILLSAYLGNREFVRLLFELPLTAIIIRKCVKAFYYSKRVEEVFERFQLLFDNMENNMLDHKKTAAALRSIIEYETALSWAGLPLDSNVFDRYEDQLADQWKAIKIQYRITNTV